MFHRGAIDSCGRSQSLAPAGGFTERVVTSFGYKEFAEIVAYCRKRKMSLYALAKKAIREYIEQNS